MSGFDEARRRALIGDLVAHLGGRQHELLSFDDVRERLKLKHFVDRGLQEVPLDRIVGTLGRIREFNRTFLPREESLRDRWRRLEALARGPEGFPPIDLYQVGEAYFVVDGHHRVSVARSLQSPTIESRVREFVSKVPLESTASAEEVLLKSGYADFLDVTGLEPEHPDEFRVTVVPGYERLLEHIAVHRYFRGIDLDRPFGGDEAVASWRDLVHRPMVRKICESGVMEHFPNRTPTDLYLFVMDHLQHLRERYGERPVAPDTALRHFRIFGLETNDRAARGWLRRVFGRRSSGDR